MSADQLAGDALIAGLARDTRSRTWTILPFTILGIVAGAVVGIAFAMNVLPWKGTAGARNPAALIFFIAPPLVCYALGSVLYRVASWRASRAH